MLRTADELVRLHGLDLANVAISGQIENLRVNGVDVVPLVERSSTVATPTG